LRVDEAVAAWRNGQASTAETTQITDVLSHPTSQELLGRALTRLAYVAESGLVRPGQR